MNLVSLQTIFGIIDMIFLSIFIFAVVFIIFVILIVLKLMKSNVNHKISKKRIHDVQIETQMAKMESKPNIDYETEKYCTYCGSRVNRKMIYCENCGAKLVD